VARTLAAAGLAALALAGAGFAAWPLGASGNGSARALSLGAGPAPTAGTITGVLTKSVPLSWSAVPGASGYIVMRYSSIGLPTVIGGTCTGVVAATSCTDTNVPPGLTWLYTVQPANGLWLGTEGPATTVTT